MIKRLSFDKKEPRKFVPDKWEPKDWNEVIAEILKIMKQELREALKE